MDMISLASGATYFNSPEPASQAAIAAIENHKTFYGEVAGTLALRQAIARRYLNHNQTVVNPANILVTPGTKQGLYNVLHAILQPGDEVILPNPHWFGLRQLVEILGASVVALPTSLADNYALQPGKLRECITPKTRLFLFSNPCNPTGRRYSREELQNLLEVTGKHPGMYVIADEIYDLVTFGETVPSLLELPDPGNRHIVVNGFSKSFAMTGWRIGYVVAPVALTETCRQFQHVTFSGVSEFVQDAALVLMQAYGQLLPPMMEMLRENKLIITQYLTARGILYYSPDAAYYVFPDLGQFLTNKIPTITHLADWLKAHYALEILSGDLFGAPGFARLSFGIRQADLKEGLHRLGLALEALRGEKQVVRPEV